MSALIDRKPPVRTNGHPDPRTAPKPALTRQPTAEERRRAQRVLLRIKIVVHIAGKPSLTGFTHTVNANGAMIIVPEPLAEGTTLSVENPKTQVTVEARVVRPPQITSDGSLVPVEFATPSPHFWNVFFPPAVN
jgi:PilZ domain